MLNKLLLDDAARFELDRSKDAAELNKSLKRIEKWIRDLLKKGISGEDRSKLNMLVIASEDLQKLEVIGKCLLLIDSKKKDLEINNLERLIEFSMPQVDISSPDEFWEHAIQNGKYRTRFLENVPMLDAEGIHKLSGSTANNKSQRAGSWLKSRKVFCVENQNRKLYPLFQFDDLGKPKPVIGRILKALGPNMGPWQTAIWFTSENSSLERKQPVNVLDKDPDSVVSAAEQLTEDNLF